MQNYEPKSPLLSPRYADISTFSRLPHTQDLRKVNLVIVGIPYDGGTTFRPGARFGPRGIRQASCMNRNVHPIHQLNIYEKLSPIDYGDIPCNPLSFLKTQKIIEKSYTDFLKQKIIPIGLGGDHSVLLPILRTFKKYYGRFGLIQFDAHTDTADQAWGEKYHHGTPVRRLIEEGVLKGSDIYQIGIRGPLTSKDQLAWDQKQGILHLTIEAYNQKGFKPFIKKINSNIPYYLSFDIDGVDPAFAPGTGTPVVGGLTSYQALECVRSLHQLRFIGFDVVEVAPIYDHAEITTLLASALVFEFMSLAAATSTTK